MLYLEFFALLVPMVSAIYRDNMKTMKTLPAFTNSMVNLGKMDFSFYFMTKPEDFKKYENPIHSPYIFPPKTETPVEESCPCTSRYSRNFPKNNPSELLKKILTSNDLFSYNKEPETSYLCCESHENVHEETIMFEFNPKQNPVKEFPLQQSQLPFLPLILENAIPNKPILPMKPKAVEIFFFPKKKDMIVEYGKNKKKEFNKEAIQIVGDKEIRNDFKNMKLTPPQPAQSSVKKDLGLQEKVNAQMTKTEGIKIETTDNPNIL